MSESLSSAERSSRRRRRTQSPTPRREWLLDLLKCIRDPVSDNNLPLLFFFTNLCTRTTVPRSSDSSPLNVFSAAVTSALWLAERLRSRKLRSTSTTSLLPSERTRGETTASTRRSSGLLLRTRPVSRPSPSLLKRILSVASLRCFFRTVGSARGTGQ